MPKKFISNVDSHTAETVWAASVAANRINGEYLKFDKIGADGKGESALIAKSNKNLIMDILNAGDQITPDDIEMGKTIRSHFKGLTFKILQGKKLSDFENMVMALANRDTIGSFYDIAVLASLPEGYKREIARKQISQRINDASGFVGSVGDKVTVKLEIVRQVYSIQFSTYFITGITPDNQAVFFSFKNPIEIGNTVLVTGNVKAHRTNDQGEVTQLNRAKVKE